MKRVGVVAVGVMVLMAITAVAFVRGAVPGTEGCVLRSVDKQEYVARNEAVFRTIQLPPYLLEANTNTWTHAIPARNPCFPFGDTGPPYGAYITTHVYIQRPGEPPLGFDQRILGGRWVREESGGVSSDNFHRGVASLNVTTSSDAVELSVDYRGYAGREP